MTEKTLLEQLLDANQPRTFRVEILEKTTQQEPETIDDEENPS